MFRELAPLLCALGHRPRKLPPVVLEPLLAFLVDLPGRDERLLWQEIRGSVRLCWDTADQCAATIDQAADALGVADDRLALVVHPAEAGLMLRRSALLSAWPVLHPRLYGTIWIFDMSAPVRLIEVSYVDRETCYSPFLV